MWLRVFLAVFPALAIREEISRLCARRELPEARWTRVPQMHFTLLFLGDRPASELSRIADALDRVCAARPAVELELSGLGVFPNRRRARVAFVRIKRGAGYLTEIAKELRAALDEPADRDFVPHLTLARFRAAPSQEQLEAMDADFAGRRWLWTPSEACLVRSELRPDGAVYELRHRSRLGPPAAE